MKELLNLKLLNEKLKNTVIADPVYVVFPKIKVDVVQQDEAFYRGESLQLTWEIGIICIKCQEQASSRLTENRKV